MAQTHTKEEKYQQTLDELESESMPTNLNFSFLFLLSACGDWGPIRYQVRALQDSRKLGTESTRYLPGLQEGEESCRVRRRARLVKSFQVLVRSEVRSLTENGGI